MEIIRLFFFLILGAYVFQFILRGRIGINWVLILSAVFFHAIYFFGLIGLVFLLTSGVISTLIELVSLKTPFNFFGVTYRYNFSSLWFPSKIILGKVLPIEVSAAWIFLKYLSFFLTTFIFSLFGVTGLARAFFGAFFLVSFDFILDPVAVSLGVWEWKESGIFFGVPWKNFLGWFLVGFIISIPFLNLEPVVKVDSLMVFPVILVTSLFITTHGKRIIGMNWLMGTLAVIPLSTFVLLALTLLI